MEEKIKINERIEVPNTTEGVEEMEIHRPHPHEDISKIGGDFDVLESKLTDHFVIARKDATHETLGRVNKTLEAIQSAGIMEQFPGLTEKALELHKTADTVLSQ